MNTLKKLFFLLLLLSLLPAGVYAAQITASFDRNPVGLDESFQIIFSADDTPDDDPDFSPLEQDFEILGQSQSSNSSWINGKSSKTIQWTLNVMAKHAGNLNVPTIKFGNDASSPATITVTQGSANKAIDNNNDLFLDVEASPQSPYVQSQVLYTVRLYRRVEIAQAGLNEPELADAVIEKLGDDSNYNTQVDGVNYLVTERKYAIFPQKSGAMTIKPLLLTAEVMAANRPSFNGFFSSQLTKTRKISSKPVTLEVKPAPTTFSNKHWLPAEQLVLKEEWSGDNQQMKVGEPLTRTLTLLAKGTTVGQLPEINNKQIDAQLKTYPDQPALREQKKAEGLIAFREEKIAIIPSKAGFYKLPAIEIPWFNTQTQKMEIAKIPETSITVVDATGALSEPALPQVSEATAEPQKSEQPMPVVAVQPQASNPWLLVSVCLALGWLATVVYFLRKKPAATQPSTGQTERQTRMQDSIGKLKKACNDNNADAAKEALLSWAKQKFSAQTVASLGAIAELSDARLRDEILILNRVLYSKTPTTWHGKKLFQAFVENKAREKIASSEDDRLEPLYRL